jgi:hypothetical protein
MQRLLIFRERPAEAAQFVNRQRQLVHSATVALRSIILKTTTSPIAP